MSSEEGNEETVPALVMPTTTVEIPTEEDKFLCDIYPEEKIVCGNFQLKDGQFLGAGQDSITRQATCLHTGKHVAIKRYDLRDESDVEANKRKWYKFVALVQAHGFLKHAHAVVLYCLDFSKDSVGKPHVNEEDHCCYVVMELGAFTLQDYLIERRKCKDGGLTLCEVLELFLSMTEIVAAIHREGCVHLNLTPCAFIQTADERKWKLYDVERIRRSNSSISVDNANIEFDPLYMAPELAVSMRSAKVSVRLAQSMDIFSFGAIMAELLMSQPIQLGPHRVIRDSPDFLHYLCEPQIEIPLQIRRFDMELYKLLSKMLSLQAKDRVQILDIMESDVYKRALTSELDQDLEKELHLCGVKCNQERRVAMLERAHETLSETQKRYRARLEAHPMDINEETDPAHIIAQKIKYLSAQGTPAASPRRGGADANPVVTIASLRNSILFRDPVTGVLRTRFVETPHGYDPHDYHDVDEFVDTDEPPHPPARVPAEPQHATHHDDKLPMKPAKDTLPRISWNFRKKPLFETNEDYFYRWAKRKTEYGPFTAAQIKIWAERGFFDDHRALIRSREVDYFSELDEYLEYINEIGSFQLHSTEYSRLYKNDENANNVN